MNVESLKQKLIEANNAYHNGEPIMTDDEFDALVTKWESETGKKWVDEVGVGAPPKESSVPLPMWMGSMNKVKEEKDIGSWIKRNKSPNKFVVSDKLDGISCLFYWSPGEQKYQVFTRGDGTKGTDITWTTDHIPGLISIKSVVKQSKIHSKKIKWLFNNSLEYFIRGELVIPRESWDTERNTTWKEYANPRNTVAGLVNRKRHKSNALSKIHFVPFSIDMKQRKTGTWMPMTKPRMFSYIDSLIKCVGSIESVYHNEVSSVDKTVLSELLQERRSHSPYEIDGIVVWDGETKHTPNLSGNPTHAFAFKMVMEDQKAETLVTEIEWNLSRQNVWKPVVVFSPVVVGGTRISRATGHNAKWLLDRGIGVGSRIVLIRSGDVIPKIHSVVTKVTTTQMPSEGTWEWDSNHTNIILKESTSSHVNNYKGLVRRAHYFVSTLKAKGLSTKNLEKYVDVYKENVCKLPFPHLFPLIATKEEWLKLDGVKEKSADTFVNAVRNGWHGADTSVKLVALGVLPRGVGIKQMALLERHHIIASVLDGSIESSELQHVEGMGPQRIKDIIQARSTVQSVWEWVNKNVPPPSTSSSRSTPKKRKQKVSLDQFIEIDLIRDKEYILITGFRNQDLVDSLTQMGKKIISSLSKRHTAANTVVITKAGTNNTKIEKANSAGIKILELKN